MLNRYRYHAGQFNQDFFSIQVTGSDAESFLHNQTTYDVKAIALSGFHLVSMLDPQGRVETYFFVLKRSDAFTLLVPKKILEKTVTRLNKFLIAEDVELSKAEYESWTIIIGPKGAQYLPKRDHDAFVGEIFEETALLIPGILEHEINPLGPEDIQAWVALSGYPSLDGEDAPVDIINNNRLFDLTVSLKKGCYPGQETVSKIHYNRGAAYAPVLIEMKSKPHFETLPLELSFQGKKIGTVKSFHELKNHWYLSASLLRDFRVEFLDIDATTVSGTPIKGKVRYFPLLPSDARAKAEELFHDASEFFKKDNLAMAEEAFLLAIDVDPTYADAFEAIGVLYGRTERFPQAIEMMEKLTTVDPSSVMAYTNKSLYLMKMGKIEEAEEAKTQATLKSFAKFGEEAKLKEETQKLKQAELEDLARREGMYRQVLEIDSDDTLANYGLGTIYLDRHEIPEAIACLEKVVIQDERYSVAYLALGKAFAEAGDKVKARDVWERGIKIAAAKGDLMPANQMQSLLSKT